VTEHLLSRIPGGCIAKALMTLPPAAKADDGAIMDCFVNVPELGRVRIIAAHEAQARRVNASLLHGGKRRAGGMPRQIHARCGGRAVGRARE